ncbi:ABC transporter permease [Pseudomonas sp. RGM2987]|uniref:ABC transporter permease n=1 Tax=Pseudomonas sp. RGM2987 TaxID=2930090 RepID=UPI001FD6946D|nr:ABC transporter permease [Pseudomonas sp. RGM2987]MCJ8207515.1 ABC transporter permease [Pseudomonas sp. RGM2987]
MRKFFVRAQVSLPNWHRVVHSRIMGWAAIVACIFTWELVVKTGLLVSPSLPAASTAAATWWREITEGTLSTELASTLGIMAVGYFCAAVLGISLGLLMASARPAWALLEPVVELLRPVPVSATVPLLILFLGIDSKLKIVSVALGAVFPILLATYAGVKSVTPTMRETACTFQLTRWQTLKEVLVPSAAPHISIGLRTSLAISLIVTVFAEMIAGSSGIGFFILQAQQTLSVDKLYAGVLMLAIVGYILNAAFLQMENLILPWRVGGPRRRH